LAVDVATHYQAQGLGSPHAASFDHQSRWPLYAGDPIGVDLDASLYALDSTTIDLCLSRPRIASKRIPEKPLPGDNARADGTEN